jgi:PKD repeat protein
VQSNLPTTNIKASYPDYAAANEGYPIYDRLDHLYVASQNPHIDFPVMLLGVGKQDRQAGWNEKPRFAKAMNASYHQFFMYWENVGHKFSTTLFKNAYSRTQLLNYRLNQSYVSINFLSIDDNPGEGNDLLPGGTVTGEPQGTINGYAEWDPSTIVDTATEYRVKVYLRGAEMDQFPNTRGVSTATATLTPRRLQQFPRLAGKQYTYENRRASDNALVANGTVTADAYGLIHVTGFQISREGNILILRPGTGGTLNQPPKALASASPTSGNAPLAVNFTGSNSSDPDGSIVSYAWNFGDGTSSASANPQHTYNAAGSYTATLTVTDNGGLTNSASVVIAVTTAPVNQPPRAVASANPASGVAPLTVNFTGVNSNDPDGSIVSYAWNFGDGTSSTLANPQHTYNAAGSYTATLTVTDNGGLAHSAAVTITVAVGNGAGNRPPVATISLPVENSTFLTNTKINYAGDASDPEDGVLPLTSFTWQLIRPDGSIKLIAIGKKSGREKVGKIGMHKLQCIVKDSHGAADTAEVHFTVVSTLPKTGDGDIAHSLPDGYVLEQNQPNPFNPITTIAFYLKAAGHVRLTIYNTVGQKIVTLVDRELPAGYYKRTVHARAWPSGIYFYELQVNDFRELKKMILTR